MHETAPEGVILWSPPQDLRETTEIGRFMAWLSSELGLEFSGYDELWRWSVGDLDAFWAAVAGFFQIRFRTPYEHVLGSRTMPGAQWFPGARLNYGEHLLGRDGDEDTVAILARSQTRP